MWAIIGLGNPGRSYARSRHNVGHFFIRCLASEWGLQLRKRKMQARTAVIKRSGEKVVLVQPTTFMNLSGLAARQVLDGYGIEPDRAIFVYDDLDIPLGQVRIRKEGSAGSHNGLRSVIENLGTKAFPRIRIGIGPLHDRKNAVHFVLSPFEAKEIPLLEEGLKKAREGLEMILDGRIDQAMNRFNQKEVTRE